MKREHRMRLWVVVVAWTAFAHAAPAQIPVIEPSQSLNISAFLPSVADINDGTIVGLGSGGLAVFERTSSDNWVQTASLPTEEGIGPVRVALYRDTLIATSVGIREPTALYVFARRQGEWQRVQRLLIEVLDLALGARLAAATGSPVGQVHVFRRQPGDTLELETTLTIEDTGLGIDLQLAIAGDTVLVADSAANNLRGVVHAFEERRGVWRELSTLTPSDPETSGFGRRIQTLGHIALIGGNRDAYVFERVGGDWIEQARLFSSDPSVGFQASLVDRHRVVVELFTEAGVTRYLARIGGTDGWTPIAQLGPVLSASGEPIFVDSTRGFVLSFEGTSGAFVYDVRSWH